MDLLLAEFIPDANFLLHFVGTIGFLLVIFEKGKTLFGKSEAQRREVSFAEEFAKREDLERVEKQVERVEEKLEHALEGLRTEMKEDRELIMRAGEERAIKIHDRINDVLKGVSHLAGRFDK